jgi:hypothetical protein
LCWAGTQIGGGGTGSSPPPSPSAGSSSRRGDCDCFERGPCDFLDDFFTSRSCPVCPRADRKYVLVLRFRPEREDRTGAVAGRCAAARSATSAAAAAGAVADERLVVLSGRPDRRGRGRLVVAGGLTECMRVEWTRLELPGPRYQPTGVWLSQLQQPGGDEVAIRRGQDETRRPTAPGCCPDHIARRFASMSW